MLPVPWLVVRHCFAPLRDLSHVAPLTTYELWADLPTPLVSQHLRSPIGERTYSDDTALRRVPPEEVEAAVALMLAQRVGSVAIAFLHSYVHPENEREAARLLRVFGRRHPRPPRAPRLPAQPERRIHARETPTVDPNQSQRLMIQHPRRLAPTGDHYFARNR